MTSSWKPKRFWTAATVAEVEGGYAVHLDSRPVRTPAKTLLVVPARALAEVIAVEWDAQEKAVDPLTMPATRLANAALDKVRPQHAEVADMLAAYGGTDLICYRAEAPAELVARQAGEWDPLLAWATDALGATLETGAGVMHIDQPRESLAALSRRVHALDPFALAAFHDLVGISGSLVIAFAVAQGRLAPEEGWRLSRIDEDWQIEQWGEDDEANALAARKKQDFLRAAEFYRLVAPQG